MALQGWALTPAEAASPWGTWVMPFLQRAEDVPTPTSGPLVPNLCWPLPLQGAWGGKGADRPPSHSLSPLQRPLLQPDLPGSADWKALLQGKCPQG